MNSCGAGPRVSMGWGLPSEFRSNPRLRRRDRDQPICEDVLTTPVMTAVYPATPSYSVELPPGRYYTRARRLASRCDEHSNPSRELTFEILP
jgi:hypothetical protein